MRDLEQILDINSSDSHEVAISDVTKAIDTVKKNYDVVFESENFNEDFDFVRDNLKNMISDISETTQKLNMIALDSEKAPFFSALSQLMGTILAAQKQLVEMHSVKQKFMKDNFPSSAEGTTNVKIENAAFVGTTEGLRDFLNKKNQSL